MQEVFVVEALRTPFGSLGGALSRIPAAKLGATVIKALMERSGLDAAAVDEVIAGQVLSGGCGQAPARQAMRYAGLPDSVAAMTINKVCGSGLKAMMLAADAIRLGNAAVVVAGGMENMSLAPHLLAQARAGYRLGGGELVDLMIADGLQDPYSGNHMGVIAEAAVARNHISRDRQDDYARRSYQRAQQAVEQGIFAAELVSVAAGRKGELTVAQDEEPFKCNLDKMTQLRPVFAKDGSITAANASIISDGAAFALLAGEKAVKQHNLTVRARLVAAATSSLAPDYFPEAPVEAIGKVCERAGIRLDEIALFEINEAFAAVALLAIDALKLDEDKVNVNGGAVSIGHPLGASGARLAATLVRELHRRRQRYGLAVLCIGGGEAVAAIFERV